MDDEEDYLMISGLQHFDFCRRQWALIHLEQQWEENVLTAEGRIEHSVCHDESKTEKRNDIIIMRGMRVISHKLKLTGVCDVVEFHLTDEGISLSKYDGEWMPIPIEYKHGHSKSIDADRLQLCAQAMALEEMLVCEIPYGYLYYKETNKREKVLFDLEMRNKVENMAKGMCSLFQSGWTPKAKTSSKCSRCSLNDICLPSLNRGDNTSRYIDAHLMEGG